MDFLKKRWVQVIWRLLVTAVIAFGSFVLGLVVGALIGGNVGCFELPNGLRGYESCGAVFAYVGLFVGLGIGMRYTARLFQEERPAKKK